MAGHDQPRRQHTVPRFYLSNFADTHGKIQVLHRLNDKSWQQKPKDVSVQNNIYTLPEQPGINRFIVEEALAKIESDVAPVLNRIVTSGGNITQEEKRQLSIYLATQIRRSKSIDRHTDSMNEELAAKPEAIIRLIENKKQFFLERFSEEQYSEFIDRLRSGVERISLPNQLIMLARLSKVPNHAEYIFDMVWRIEIARQSLFFTSDNPVFTRRRGRPFDENFIPVGRHDLNVELYFPLSPKMLMIADWKGDRPPKMNASPARVRELNRLTAICSDQYLYSSRFSDSDIELINETKPHAVRMMAEEPRHDKLSFDK